MCVHSSTPWVSPMNSPVRLGVSPAAISTPTGVFSQRFEASFPRTGALGCGSVLLPSCSSCFIHTRMRDRLVRQLLPRCESTPPWLPIPPLLLVWMNVSLSPWLSDFHIVCFSVSSGCFLFLNLLFSFFWLCKEAQCVSYTPILAGSPLFVFLRLLNSSSSLL